MTNRGRPSAAPRVHGLGPAAAFPALVVVTPIAALLWRLPWSSLIDRLNSSVLLHALWISLFTTTVATIGATVWGTAAGVYLHFGRLRWANALRAAAHAVTVMPPVVGGLVLLLAFGRAGIVGGPVFRAVGISLPFSTAGVIAAQLFVSMPFVVMSVDAALEQHGTTTLDAARVCGVGTSAALRRAVLGAIRPAIVAGSAMAWARALGEFGATITFAGSIPGRTDTLPLAIYGALDSDPRTALAMAAVLMVIAFGGLWILRSRLGPRGTWTPRWT